MAAAILEEMGTLGPQIHIFNTWQCCGELESASAPNEVVNTNPLILPCSGEPRQFFLLWLTEEAPVSLYVSFCVRPHVMLIRSSTAPLHYRRIHFMCLTLFSSGFTCLSATSSAVQVWPPPPRDLSLGAGRQVKGGDMYGVGKIPTSPWQKCQQRE